MEDGSNMQESVIILGNDHTNTIGLVQSYGRMGIRPIVAVWGINTGLSKSSCYTSEIISGENPQACVDKIIERRKDLKNAVIVPGCDDAAYILEANLAMLKPWFKFQHTNKARSIKFLQEKNHQVEIASAVGFNTPKSWYIEDINDIPSDIIFPCLIKPLASVYGSKNDLIVSQTLDELVNNLTIVLKRTPKVLLQQYIDKDYDFIVHGVGLSNGKVIIPSIIRKDLIYPRNVGLSSYCTISKLTDVDLYDAIARYIKEIGYVGLFSAEFIRSKDDGKMYFCEVNMRNDGKVGMITKAGINLPYIHYCDLAGLTIPDECEITDCSAIWEIHHFQSLIHRNISLITWFKQIKDASIFMVYDKSDKGPLYRQFSNWFLEKLHIRKLKRY